MPHECAYLGNFDEYNISFTGFKGKFFVFILIIGFETK